MRPALIILAVLALLAPTARAQTGAADLVPVADAVGIGMSYLDLVVDPKTLPAGPFLGRDRKGRLVATVYMIPIDDMRDGKAWSELPAPNAPVDHVDLAYNPGHAGVPNPHYHVVLWHVGKAEQDAIVAAGAPDAAAPGLKRLSELGRLPDFIPGLGTLYVDPKALPVGPFLGFDREGRQVNTIYMVPLKDMNERKRFGGLAAPPGPVDHVDIYYNNGHPSVPVPHYHIVEWHIGKAEQAALSADPGLAAQRAQQAPPPDPFRKASEALGMPAFIPGLGALYIDPRTAPTGPYLAYGRNGRLVATIHMVPLSALEAHQRLGNLAASGGKVDHVDIYFNRGHAGLPEPHYHLVLWHLGAAEAASLVK